MRWIPLHWRQNIRAARISSSNWVCIMYNNVQHPVFYKSILWVSVLVLLRAQLEWKPQLLWLFAPELLKIWVFLLEHWSLFPFLENRHGLNFEKKEWKNLNKTYFFLSEKLPRHKTVAATHQGKPRMDETPIVTPTINMSKWYPHPFWKAMLIILKNNSQIWTPLKTNVFALQV